MEESILKSVKLALGIEEEYDVFDNDIIMHINSVFMILRQMGIGPADGLRIEGADILWEDFIPIDNFLYECVRSYVCAKVRLMFDPPNASAHKEALNQTISELEWRLNWEYELGLSN